MKNWALLDTRRGIESRSSVISLICYIRPRANSASKGTATRPHVHPRNKASSTWHIHRIKGWQSGNPSVQKCDEVKGMLIGVFTVAANAASAAAADDD